MTQAELEMRLAVWQKRLRCQDWIITARMVEDLQSEGGDVYGLCWPNRSGPDAKISIRSNPCTDGTTQPYEWTLIHELLHVLLPKVKPKGHEEPAINKIAWALYRAYNPERP